MRESESHEKWRPAARVALQRNVGGDKIDTVGTAYNRSSMARRPQDNDVLNKSAMCLEADCARWEPSPFNFMCYMPIIGYFWRRCGRCGLEK